MRIKGIFTPTLQLPRNLKGRVEDSTRDQDPLIKEHTFDHNILVAEWIHFTFLGDISTH